MRRTPPPWGWRGSPVTAGLLLSRSGLAGQVDLEFERSLDLDVAHGGLDLVRRQAAVNGDEVDDQAHRGRDEQVPPVADVVGRQQGYAEHLGRRAVVLAVPGNNEQRGQPREDPPPGADVEYRPLLRRLGDLVHGEEDEPDQDERVEP